jgi:hypothetical protein
MTDVRDIYCHLKILGLSVSSVVHGLKYDWRFESYDVIDLRGQMKVPTGFSHTRFVVMILA